MTKIKSVMLLLLVLLLLLVILHKTDIEGYGRRHGHLGGRRQRWGSMQGYRYRRPHHQPSYLWYNPWFWYGNDCKNGCTNLGKGRWGCQYPGVGINMCRFADDCYGC